MARGINKVILIGNLGADPDARMTQQGSAVTNLNIATDESYKDKNTGQMVPKTEWHRVVMFNRLAEIAKDYLRKGSKVYIEGRLQTRKWQDQSGQDRYTTEVVVSGFNGTLQMLDRRDNASSSAPSENVTPNGNFLVHNLCKRKDNHHESFVPFCHMNLCYFFSINTFLDQISIVNFRGMGEQRGVYL